MPENIEEMQAVSTRVGAPCPDRKFRGAAKTTIVIPVRPIVSLPQSGIHSLAPPGNESVCDVTRQIFWEHIGDPPLFRQKIAVSISAHTPNPFAYF